jgi:diaminohydroxyphosphoribosylaminopyrimidine deaminase/5-amino-6-(5-phosphoribosylamino)uracil reductase
VSISADEPFMIEAIELAMRGRGFVEPNPMVGCVIVKDGRIIGRGVHQKYGSPHAEPNALAACTESPAGATAYVTLEPCCHTDKQTPPCVPKLIEAKLARVVVGCLDPNPKVCGNGIRQLKDAGIHVDVDVCGDECKQLIGPFTARVRWKRPYVTLKWAQTADGKVAGPDGSRLQISGPMVNRAVHGLRGRCDAIVVGINTVLSDDPLLTARGVPALRNPIRAVLDSNLRIPLASNLVKTAREHPVIVYTADRQQSAEQMQHAGQLNDLGVQIVSVPVIQGHGLNLGAPLLDLAKRGCTHVLVEPGPALAAQFMRVKWADRIWRIQSKKIRCESGILALMIPEFFRPVGEVELGDDVLTEFLNTDNHIFAGPFPSADFRLISNATFAPEAG